MTTQSNENLQLKEIDLQQIPCHENKFHLLPCKVQHCGDAPVAKYFDSTITQEKNDSDASFLKSSFQGRPLNGKVIKLPPNYTGLCLKEDQNTHSDEVPKLEITDSFKSFTFWNWDKIPSTNDSLIQMMDWFPISQAIHAPVHSENGCKISAKETVAD